MLNWFASKPVKITMNILKVIFFLILVAFILMVVLQRVSDNRISFFNFRMFTVISGSMQPQYKIGDVLIAQEIAPEELVVGDTVSYIGKYGDLADKVITHKIIEIDQENGEYVFTTKGIANVAEDPPVQESQLLGKVVYKSILLSSIYGIISTDIGFFLFIIIPILIIVAYEIIKTLMEKEEDRRGKYRY